jgi:cysteinyl-tRNA synthetase
MEYLGETLDIHGGGLDLQFPHHENELAQSESFTGKPFARVWMHNGLLKMGHAKMAGSVGNVVNIVDLLERHHPETVRFLLLATHYRSPIEYSEERLVEVAKALQGFYSFFERYERIARESFYHLQAPTQSSGVPEEGSASSRSWSTGTSPTEDRQHIRAHKSDFLRCMDDDFNTGGAVGILFELVTTLNRIVDSRKLEADTSATQFLEVFREGVVTLKELSQILGLFWEPVRITVTTSSTAATTTTTMPPRNVDFDLEALKQLAAEFGIAAAPNADANTLIQQLVQMRAEARKAKNFAVADQIRKRLGELHVTLEDRPGSKTG